MLQLDIRDSALDRCMSPRRLHLDNSPLYTEHFSNSFFRGRRIPARNLGYPELPYLFNLDKVTQNTMVLQENEGAQINYTELDRVLNSFEEAYQDNHLYIIRMFAYDFKILDDYFNEKIEYDVQKDNNIALLFNKTMVDAIDRNGVTNIPNAGVRICNHKEKNIIYEVINYNDEEQASDYFLLLGIIPMLYPDIKNKLNDNEKRYIKELIRRSQVKRVRNVEVENYFYAMYIDKKYKDAMKDLRLKAELEIIMRNRTQRLRNRIDSLLRQRDGLLNQYEQTLNELQDDMKNLDDLEHNDSFMEEVKTVMDMPFVLDLHATSDSIMITLKTELEFFDPELLEINLNNASRYDNQMTNEFFKQIFIEGKYKYTVGNQFKFQLDNNSCNLPREIAYRGNLLQDLQSLYNPHIEYFSCYGDNQRAIIQAHQAKDLVGFINACLIALKNINFADAPVFSRWYRDMQYMLTNEYGGDSNYLINKSLLDVETGEYISIRDWRLKYQEEVVANAPEIDVHEAGTEAEDVFEDDDDEEEEDW